MSRPNPKSAKDALRADEANGARRRTVKKKSRPGSSRPQAAERTTKKAAIIKLLCRKQGATLTALQDATGWKPHSVRAALTGLRKTGVEIQRATNAQGRDGLPCGRIVSGMSGKQLGRCLEDGGQALANPPCRKDLVEAWQTAYGRPPPKRIGTRLLLLAWAYRRQVARHGGLSPASKRKLAAWATIQPESSQPTTPAAKRGPAKGTRLIRVWHGETHVVDLLDDGVLYEGKTYRSLSAVARVITGARWSGPRFFGL